MLSYGIRETTVGAGTAVLNISLSSVSGFPRFSSKFADKDLVGYSILDTSVTPYVPVEIGLGTYKASNTLDRTYPLQTWDGSTFTDVSCSKQTLVNARTYLVICTPLIDGQVPSIHAVSNSGSATRRIQSAHDTGFGGGTMTLSALTLYVVPFQLDSLKAAVDIAIRVSSAAAAGKLLKLGLYRLNDAGDITDLLEGSGNIAADTTGIKSYTFAATKKYPSGWYCAAVASDGAPIINSPSTSAQGGTPWGVDSNNQNIAARTTTVGSLTLPNPFTGTLTNVLATTPHPHFTIGVAA